MRVKTTGIRQARFSQKLFECWVTRRRARWRSAQLTQLACTEGGACRPTEFSRDVTKSDALCNYRGWDLHGVIKVR